jgi:5S rRNA maturation endonuclease (ribonuclease M5)
MIQKYESVFNKTPISIVDVFQNQELVFYTFLGVFPSREVRTLSLFRKDNSPNCRFEYFDSLWWFVDNATYKDKLYFNCIELVMYMHDIDFKSALEVIKSRINIKGKTETISAPIFDNKDDYGIKIKITYDEWKESNYFSDNYFINHHYLNSQPYYNINTYWTNSKSSPILKKNKFGLPKNRIAYYFEDSNKIKLYFPDNNLNDIKWYSNATEKDLFGWHRIGDYLISENSALFITSSGKDELMINYYLDGQSIALQGETIYKLPEDKLWIIKWFDPIYIWMDADEAGVRCTRRLSKFLKKTFPTKNIVELYHNKREGKDISEIIGNTNNEKNAKERLNKIWKSLKREIL